MCSATSNETAFSGNASTDLKSVFPQLTPGDIQAFLDEYPESEFANATQRGKTIIGEVKLRCGVSFLLEQRFMWISKYQCDPNEIFI
jgi:hypothetical protein